MQTDWIGDAMKVLAKTGCKPRKALESMLLEYLDGKESREEVIEALITVLKKIWMSFKPHVQKEVQDALVLFMSRGGE